LFWLNGDSSTRLTNTEENSMAILNAPTKLTEMNATTKFPQIRVTRRSPTYWRVTIDNPPINVMGPEMVKQFQEVMNALEADEQVRVVVFDSAVEDYFLNHSDFTAKLEDLTSLPAGPTGLPPWPDFLVRLTRLPVASIALIRGRATGNGSEITLACDMSFASREKTIISQWEVGVGMVAAGGPMARLPHLIGRNRALEVLLSSEDIRAEQAEAYGYINRALPDASTSRGTSKIGSDTISAKLRRQDERSAKERSTKVGAEFFSARSGDPRGAGSALGGVRCQRF
jgi:enoyl-CoA hydratase/carnithine racemase